MEIAEESPAAAEAMNDRQLRDRLTLSATSDPTHGPSSREAVRQLVDGGFRIPQESLTKVHGAWNFLSSPMSTYTRALVNNVLVAGDADADYRDFLPVVAALHGQEAAAKDLFLYFALHGIKEHADMQSSWEVSCTRLFEPNARGIGLLPDMVEMMREQGTLAPDSLESICAAFRFRGRCSPAGRSMLESLLAREQMSMRIDAAAAPAATVAPVRRSRAV